MKKLICMLLSVALISTSVPKVQASWFSDLMGGLFTVITAPIWVFCQDNEFFRKQNPFRKKVWQEQEETDRRIESAISRYATMTSHIDYDEITSHVLDDIEDEYEDEIIARAKKEIKKDYKERIKKIEKELAEGMEKTLKAIGDEIYEEVKKGFDTFNERLGEDEKAISGLIARVQELAEVVKKGFVKLQGRQ